MLKLVIMWKTKLILNAFGSFGEDELSRITLIKNAGFDGFFTGWAGKGEVARYAEIARELGLIYQSVHAPFGRIRQIWEDDEEKAEATIKEQIACIEDCGKSGIPLMVAHAFIGFEDHTPTAIGLERLERIVNAAEKASVKIAFENTEGEEYLEAIMDHFKGVSHVGFCWDAGHEMCYNHSQDLLAKYGDRLFGTHLNDNLGIKNPEGKITFYDDLHLLPFDGIADWEYNTARLVEHKFEGPLTFELKVPAKSASSDIYAQLSQEAYVFECYKRACRVAALYQKAMQ